MVVLKDIKLLGYDVQSHTTEKFLCEFPLPNFEEKVSTSQIKETENFLTNETGLNEEIQVKNKKRY